MPDDLPPLMSVTYRKLLPSVKASHGDQVGFGDGAESNSAPAVAMGAGTGLCSAVFERGTPRIS